MNKQWVDEKLRVLSLRLGIFKPNPYEFYFEPTKEIYEKLESGDACELQYVTTEIARHLGIVPVPTAKYDWDLKMEPEFAGQIKVAYIQIPFFYVGKKYAVGRILAHEMSHAFLYSKGILLEDPKENEMFTDLITVFIGLGKLLLNGLVIATDEHQSEKYVLGYLSPELIVYCYERVNTYRSIDSEVSMKNLTPEAKNLISKF
jgi:hypothetical protein